MKNVLYVPLDDRPVNLDDVIVQGRAAGINVITPVRSDIQNRLDTQAVATSQGTLQSTGSPIFGNPTNIRQFILNNAATVDGFIISTDMLAYGGLLASRELRSNGGNVYPNYDLSVTNLLDVIRIIKQSYPSKPVFVLDTIKRLATSTYVNGKGIETYNESRSLMLQPRVAKSNFQDILNSYDVLSNSSNAGIPTTFNKTQYYNARQHKFKTNRYILEQLARLNFIDFLAIGVDDASKDGVQINEINYIKAGITEWLGGSTTGQNPDRAIITADADGLGCALMARMANTLYRPGIKTTFAVQYFGDNGRDIQNGYEYMDVHENLRRHVHIVGGELVASAPDIEILVVTKSSDPTSSIAMRASATAARINSNSTSRMPTIVIDLIEGGVANQTVSETILNSQSTGRLFGYSSWNTAGNSLGIAIGMAQSRFAFVKTETQETALQAGVNAHGSLLFKRFLKDYYYKNLTIREKSVGVREYSIANPRFVGFAYSNQNMVIFNTSSVYDRVTTVVRNRMQTYKNTLAAKSAFLIGSNSTAYVVKRIASSTWIFAGYNSVVLDYQNPDFVWGRDFEITLNPSITTQ